MVTAPPAADSNGKLKKKKFKSGPQISVGVDGKMSPLVKFTDLEFPDMMLDPTIVLGVDIVTAIMLQQPWSVECEDEGYGAFIWGQLEPYRKFIIQSTLYGFLFNGYRIFETTYDIEEVEETFTEERQFLEEPQAPLPQSTNTNTEKNTSGAPVMEQLMQPRERVEVITKTRQVLRQVLVGIKALRPDLTDILLDKATGDLVGCVTRPVDGGSREVTIDKDHTVFINLDKDGYGEYGKPMLRVMQGGYQRYNVCEQGAQRYDEKCAGGFLWLGYPIGSSPYAGGSANMVGTIEDMETPNEVICDRLAKSMCAVGYACYPVAEGDDGKPIEGWKAEFLNNTGQQANFIDRLKYLDGQKLRAIGVPERSATEGSLGTKAEAEVHADVAIMVNGQRHEKVIDSINTQIVEPLNVANTEDPGKCRLVLGKLDPDSRALFTQIFVALMQDPLVGDQIGQRVDVAGLMDKLDIPIKQTTDFSEGPDDQ